MYDIYINFFLDTLNKKMKETLWFDKYVFVEWIKSYCGRLLECRRFSVPSIMYARVTSILYSRVRVRE